MKPVISQKTHYTMLLMRDNGAAGSYRVRSGVLRFCVILFCLLPVAGGAGVAVGVHYRHKAWVLSNELRTAEHELAEVRVRLEQLSNVETIASSVNGSPPKPLNADLTAEGRGDAARPAPAPSADILTLLRARNASSETSAEPTIATAPATQTAQAGQNAPPAPAPADAAGNERPPAEPAPLLVAENPAESPREPEPPLLTDPQCPVRIINFLAQPASGKRLRIRYDLIAQEQQQAAGQAAYVLVLRNGTRRNLDAFNDDNARFFSISRMKQMDGTARLPQGLEPDQIQAVDVRITLDEGGIFHQEYPLNE